MGRFHSKYKINNVYSCMPDEIQCRAVPKVQRDYSTGFRSMVYAWDKLKCDVLDLLGFNTTENLDSMYHYWRDGSRHDGVNLIRVVR